MRMGHLGILRASVRRSSGIRFLYGYAATPRAPLPCRREVIEAPETHARWPPSDDLLPTAHLATARSPHRRRYRWSCDDVRNVVETFPAHQGARGLPRRHRGRPREGGDRGVIVRRQLTAPAYAVDG